MSGGSNIFRERAMHIRSPSSVFCRSTKKRYTDKDTAEKVKIKCKRGLFSVFFDFRPFRKQKPFLQRVTPVLLRCFVDRIGAVVFADGIEIRQFVRQRFHMTVVELRIRFFVVREAEMFVVMPGGGDTVAGPAHFRVGEFL